METGWLTMEARLAYKKLMLFHHIMHSDNSRTIKRIVYVQIEEDRRNTWYGSVKRLIEKYELQLNVNESKKISLEETRQREVPTHNRGRNMEQL